MKCPKCKSEIDEKQPICPVCHKVLLLECPNCHSYSETSVCDTCGYSILVKCSKCKTTIPYKKEKCPKCGFSTAISLGYQECESDEYASIIVQFGALKKIRQNLKSRDLYAKFLNKLKNLILAQLRGVECKLIIYDNVFVINMNKELSFSTSSNKATRLALKILNSFTKLNLNVIEEFSTPLNLTLTIIKKNLEELQNLIVGLGEKKYRTGQIYKSLHLGLDFSEMTDISKAFREKLSLDYDAQSVKIIKYLQSVDGTIKFLFALRDGNVIESVLIVI